MPSVALFGVPGDAAACLFSLGHLFTSNVDATLSFRANGTRSYFLLLILGSPIHEYCHATATFW